MNKKIFLMLVIGSLFCLWRVEGRGDNEILGRELIKNGDMEIDGYWSIRGRSETKKIERSAVEKHSGNYSMHVIGYLDGDGFSGGSISFDTGKKYKISFWYKVISGQLRCFVKHGDNNNNSLLLDRTFTPTSGWQYYEEYVTETNGGGNGSIWFVTRYNKSAEFYIDDVSVKQSSTKEEMEAIERKINFATFTAKNDVLEFQDNILSLQLNPTNFNLISFRNKITGYEFLSLKQSSLWTFALKTEKGDELNIYSDSVKCNRSYSYFEGPKTESRWRSSLTLKWGGIQISGIEGSLDVIVSITLNKEEPGLSYWNFYIENQNCPCSISWVDFPSVYIRANETNPKGDFFVIPDRAGIIYQDPIHNEKCVKLGDDKYYYKYPSAPQTMQFNCFYHKEGEKEDGFYFATHDPFASTKCFFFQRDFELNPEGSLQNKIRYYPENIGISGISCLPPYETVMGIYEGDWWEASKIYRNWAINQKWCGKGPLFYRVQKENDIPRWYVENPITLLSWVGSGDTNTIDYFVKISERFGCPFVFQWYCWQGKNYDDDYPYYQTPGSKDFKEIVEKLKQRNIIGMPYVNCRLADTDLPQYPLIKANAVLLENGQIDSETYTYPHEGWVSNKFAVACPTSSWFQEVKASSVSNLINNYGVDAIYLDQIAAAPPGLCVNPRHGHPLGGGGWWQEGCREIFHKIRERCYTKYPVLTSECPIESLIDVCDGFLTPHTGYNWPKGSDIPLFESVYSGYTNLYMRHGRNISSALLNSEGKFEDIYVMTRNFICGNQMGWQPSIEAESDKDGWVFQFIHRLVKIRNEEKQFLVYGEMIKPLKISISPENEEGILYSSWKSIDNKVGIIFVNITESPISFEINFKDLPVDIKTNNFVVYGDPTPDLEKISSDKLEKPQTYKIPALGVMVIKTI